MRSRVTTRTATRAMVLIFAAFAAALASPIAQAAGNPLTPLQITPSSGCGLLTAYTAGTSLPAWSSPAPPCGAGAFTLAFNPENRLSSPFGGDSSVRERDRNAGAAEVDHRDQGVGGVESVGAV